MPTAVLLSLAPDRSERLIQSEFGLNPSLWLVPVLGGTPRRVGDVNANDATFLPDGKHLVYARDAEIHQANLDGAESRKLLSVRHFPLIARASPDGSVIRFSMGERGSITIWEVRPDGAGLHSILS